MRLNELSYKRNIGAMETFKFFTLATAEQKAELKRLIAAKKYKQGWDLVQDVIGVKLPGLGSTAGVAEDKQPGKPVIDAIQKVLPQAQEIWFHGSRATGKHRRNSDTDILVVVPDDLVGDRYLAVVRILQKLSSHFDNYDIQPTKAGTNIHRIAQEEGRLLWSNKQGVAEDSENYGGIQLSLEIEKDDEYVDDEDTDNQTIYVTATSNGRELGHVLFTIDYDSHGMVLNPQDLEVDERFRGQGVAATMYDYVKSKGYRIRRSGQQTDAGAAFWAKHKPGKNIWEQGVAEDELEEGWKDALGNLALAGAIGAGGAGGMAAKDAFNKWSSSSTAPAATAPAPQQPVAKSSIAQGVQKAQTAKQAQAKAPPQIKNITNSPLENVLKSVAQRAGLAGTELAAFMAQCAHETLDFKRLKEIGGKLDFRKYDPKHAPKKARALGNKFAGDGERYKGRGFIQLTGRHNYKVAGQALGLPLEQRPELVEDPAVAAQVAVWYWKHRVQPNVDNYNDVAAVTRMINPGMRGLQDRAENFKDYTSRT